MGRGDDVRLRRKPQEETHEEIKRTYGPPPITEPCDLCGQPANTEITWYFRPSDLTGAKTTHRFCDTHGRELHNAVVPFMRGWQYVEGASTWEGATK